MAAVMVSSFNARTLCLWLFVAVLLCCVRDGLCFTNFINQPGQEFNFQCGQQTPLFGYGISGFASTFQSTSSLQDPSDRRWQVRCSPAETLALNTSALTCTSSGPVNRLPGVNPLRFTCPSQGFLSGFHSTYESHTGDRSWDPYCCQHSFGSVVNCQETPFLNAHGGNFNFSIPASVPNSARRVVVGFEGSYVGIVPARRDRQWKYTHCELVVNCSRPPTPANGRFTGGGQYLFNSTVYYTCDDSYYLSAGSAQRTCQNNGLWSGTLPTCTKCTAIADCQELRCTTATDQYCMQCDSHYPAQASAFRNANRTCDALCSWQRNFCYPGSCPSTVDTCQCSPGFTGPSCLTISALPQLSCSAQLLSSAGNRQLTSCTNSSGIGPSTFYSNVQLADLLLQWDVSFSGPTPAPATPVYVQPAGYSVGVVSTRVYGALTRASAPSVVVTDNSLNCTGETMSALAPRTSVVQCLANATLSTQPLHNDRYQLSVYVTNGGYLTLTNFDTSMSDRYFYNGSTLLEVTNIVFDFLAPIHCSVGGSLRCNPGEELFDIGSPIVRTRNVSITFGGWSEPLSAVERYTLERYELEARGSSVCERSSSRAVLRTIPVSEVQPSITFSIQLPSGDAAYSLILSVEDTAGNAQHARRTILSDMQSTLQIDAGRPITVVSAYNSQIDGRTVAWQPNTADDVLLSAAGHFYNTLSRQRNFLMPLCTFLTPLAGAYDQPTSGLLPRTGTRNAEGVVEMYYSVLVNPASLTQPPDSSSFILSDSLDVANLTLSIPRQDSDTIVVWLRAQDLHNQTAMDSIVFMTDSTAPELTGLTLVVRSERVLLFNSADLTQLVFEFQSQDQHSGLESLTWAIGTTPFASDIAQGRVGVTLQNASECSAPTCRCAQPLNAPCQPIAYTVSLSTLPRQLLVHDHDYFLSVTATNNAGLPTVRQIQFTVDVSPPRGGYLQDSFAGSQDVNFQSSMLHRYSWSGFVDGDTEIQHYQFYVGSSCLPASNFTHPAQPTITVTPATGGQTLHTQPGTYYVTVAAVNRAFHISAPVCSDGLVIDITPPLVSEVVVNNTRMVPGVARDGQGQVWYIDADRRRSLVDSPSADCIARAVSNAEEVSRVPIRLTHRGRTATVSNSVCMSARTASFDFYLLTTNHLSVSWLSQDPESQLASFSVGASYSRNSSLNVVVPFFSTQLQQTATFHEHLTTGLDQGRGFYLHIQAENNAQVSLEATIGPIFIDSTPPEFTGSLNVSYNYSADAIQLVIPIRSFSDVQAFYPLTYSVAVGESMQDDRILPLASWELSADCSTENYSCFSVPISHLQSQLHSGQVYHVFLRATNVAGLSTTLRAPYAHIVGAPSAGMVLDIAPMQFMRMYPTDLDFSNEDVDVCTSNMTWSARWHGFSHPSHAIQYSVGLGTSPSVANVIPFVGVRDSLCWSFQLQNISLQPDVIYYTIVQASNAIGSVSVASDGCRYIANTASLLSQATVRDGTDVNQDIEVQMSLERVSIAWQAPAGLYISRVYWRLQQVTPMLQNTTEFQPIANTGQMVASVSLAAGRRYRSVLRLCHAHVCHGEIESNGFLVSALPRSGSVRAIYNVSGANVLISWDQFDSMAGQAVIDFYEVAVGTSETRPGAQLVTAWQRVSAAENQVTIPLAQPLKAYRPASATVRAHVSNGHYVMVQNAILWNADGQVQRRRDTLLRPVVYDLQRIPLTQPLPTSSADWRQVAQEFLPIESDIEYTSITTRIAAAWPEARYPVVSWSLSDRQTFLPCNHGSTIACGTVRGTVLHADVPALANGRRYFVCISAAAVMIGHEVHNESLPGVLACSDGFTVDTVPPVTGCVWAAGYVLTMPSCSGMPQTTAIYSSELSTLPVSWQAFTDVEAGRMAAHVSGVQYYEIGIGTQAGRDDVLLFRSVGLSLSTVLRDLNLAPSIRYYVTVRGVDFVGQWSQTSSHPIVVDASLPGPGYITLGNSTNPLARSVSSHTRFLANWMGFTDASSTGLRYHWALGSRPGGSSDILAYTSVSSAVSTMATTSLQDGNRVFVSVLATNDAGLSTLVTSPGFSVDLSPPVAGVVFDGSGLSSSSDVDYSDLAAGITCRWFGFSDPHSSITGYELAIGTCPTCSDVQTWMPVGLVSAFQRKRLPLESGRAYYCRVRACTSVDLCVMAVSDGVTLDSTPPVAGLVSQPVQASSSRGHLTASATGFLDPHSSLLSYIWSVGTSPGSSDVIPETFFFRDRAFNQFGLASPLPPNQTLYTTAVVRNRAGAISRQVSGPYSVDTSSPTPVAGSGAVFDELWGGSRVAGTQVSGEGVRLSWQFTSPRSAIISQTVTLTGTTGRFALTQRQLGSGRTAILRASLHDGETYTALVTACNMASICSTVSTGTLLVDSSPPITGYLSADTNTTAILSAVRQTNPTWQFSASESSVTFSLLGFSDPHSGITHFTVDVGTTYFGKDLANSSRVTLQDPLRSPQPLTVQLSRRLVNRERIYLAATAWNGVGLESRPLVHSFMVRSSTTDNSTGELVLERSDSCRVTSCAGHCTCPLNSGFCSADVSTCSALASSSLPTQDQISVSVTRSLRQLQPVQSVATSRLISFYWNGTPANSSRQVLWYDWSVGRDGESPGAGVFNAATDQVWYPIGQPQSVSVTLSAAQGLRHGVAYVVYVRAWYSHSEYAIFTSSSFTPDLMPPVRRVGWAVQDIGPAGSSVGDVDYIASTAQLAVAWSGVFDAATPSGISRFEVALGTQPGIDDASLFATYPSSTVTASLSGLNLQHGVRYFATVSAVSGNGERTSVSSDGVTVDTSPPAPGVFTITHQSRGGKVTTAVGNVSDARLYAHGANDPESGLRSSMLLIGTSPGDGDVLQVAGATLGVSPYWMVSTAERLHNLTYYLTLVGMNGAGVNASMGSMGQLDLDTTRPTTFVCLRQPVPTVNPSFEPTPAACPAVPPSAAQALSGWTATPSQLPVLVASTPDPVHGCVSVLLAGASLSQNVTTSVDSTYFLDIDLRLENCYSPDCQNETLANTLVHLTVGNQRRVITLSPSSPRSSPAWRSYSMSFVATDVQTTLAVQSTDPAYSVAIGRVQMVECADPSFAPVLDDDPIRVHNSTAVRLQQTHLSHDSAILSAQWQIDDEESGIVEYQWALGTVPGGEQYQRFTSVGLSTSADSRLLYLAHGAPVYVTVLAWNAAGRERLVTSVQHVADHTPPSIGVVWDGQTDVDYQSSLNISVHAPNLAESESAIGQCTWSAGSSTARLADILPSMVINPAAVTTRALPVNTMHGQTVYSRICCRNTAGLMSCATSDGVTILTVQPSLDSAFVTLLPADQGVYDADLNTVSQGTGLYAYLDGVAWPRYIQRYEIRLPGSPQWTSVGVADAFVVRGLSLADGEHQLLVRSIDRAGQISQPLMTNFTVFTSPPQVAPGGQVRLSRLSNTSIDVDWGGYFNSSDVLRYELSVGTEISGSDIAQTVETMMTRLQISSIRLTRSTPLNVHVALTAITTSGLYLTTSHSQSVAAVGMMSPTASLLTTSIP